MRYALGVVLVCAVMLAAAKADDYGSDVGRYQLVQLGGARADQFLLDTRTGKIWRAKCATYQEPAGCVVHAWQRETVEP